MKLLFVASESYPFIKTGGLGDVVSALPKYLQKSGVEVRLILPLYSAINREAHKIVKLYDNACVWMGNCQEFYSVYTSNEAGYPVYFIEFNKYFERNGIYHDNFSHEEYKDNGFRYAFFCRAAMQLAKDINYCPDVIHVHDWQTALLCYYLKKWNDPFFYGVKSVLTIHNLPYQGIYSQAMIPYAGIDWRDFNMSCYEHYNQVNILKGSLWFADKITTVSPAYAREILSPIGGAGLHWLLQQRQSDISGILNGIDMDSWNPAKDELIAYPYDIKTYKKGKMENKKVLRDCFGLRHDDSPVFSMAVRLSEQKGLKIFTECVEGILNNMNTQMIVMGDGEIWAQAYFQNLSNRYRGRFSYNRFNGKLEHMLDAGSDFTMLPSLYEPCGLKQMYSQRYGTLPIVRSTGGLADTVHNYNEQNGDGTGFKFHEISSSALYNTVGWANSTYWDRPDHLDNLRQNAMKQDFSWLKSTGQYLDLYHTAAKKED